MAISIYVSLITEITSTPYVFSLLSLVATGAPELWTVKICHISPFKKMSKLHLHFM
jgi:hypothetical protein